LAKVLKTKTKQRITRMTRIGKMSIPEIRDGRFVSGLSGQGKTIVFLK